MENLSQEVIMEILLRLPIKSLMRFKCVSKSWLSLIISDSYFTKLHLQRSSQQNRRVLHTYGSQMQSIDINASLHDDSAIVKLDLYPFISHVLDVDILGSRLGFLLLLHWKYDNLILRNPWTGGCKQIALPFPYNSIVLYGFCYNECTDDYLLVLASLIRVDDSPLLVLGFEVFSMRSNAWEKLACNYRHIRLAPFNKHGLVLNGAIHWLIWHLETPERLRTESIIAFDIARKNLRVVPMPNDVDLKFSHFGVLVGCLSLTKNKHDETNIWVMKEYGVKSSWTKLISLSKYCFGRDMPYVFPLCFTKDGQLVAAYGSAESTGLSKWSAKGELLEYRQLLCRNFHWGHAMVYTETLYSLP